MLKLASQLVQTLMSCERSRGTSDFPSVQNPFSGLKKALNEVLVAAAAAKEEEEEEKRAGNVE